MGMWVVMAGPRVRVGMDMGMEFGMVEAMMLFKNKDHYFKFFIT